MENRVIDKAFLLRAESKAVSVFIISQTTRNESRVSMNTKRRRKNGRSHERTEKGADRWQEWFLC